MIIRHTDFNEAVAVIQANYEQPWRELQNVLEAMPLHLTASDQAGIQGNPIFDPKGTNEYIKRELTDLGWETSLPIPAGFKVFGKHVDFGKLGLLAEVQFSNYPFLPNNAVRSDLLFRDGLDIGGHRAGVAVIVTKSQMFPASNSTLYYEQAVGQLTALARHNIFRIPIRLVGLFERIGPDVAVCFSLYGARYRRAGAARTDRLCEIVAGTTRHRLHLH